MSDGSVNDVMGLLVTKPKGSEVVPGDTDTAKVPVVEDDPTPGDGDEGDDDALWNSAEDAEDALDAEQSGEAGDAEGDESGEGEGDQENAGGDTEPFYTVTIDGKSEQVPLSEALAGYQRNRDYTVKTQKLAERQKAVETEFEAITQRRGAYDTILQDLQAKIEGGSSQRTPAEWEKLRAEDPQGYAIAAADEQRRREARDAVVKERERVAQEQQEHSAKVLNEFIGTEREKLLTKMSAWRDPAKFETGVKAIRTFTKAQYGYTDAELDKAFDHRVYLMAEDARRYRALVAAKQKGAKKLSAAPVAQIRGRTPPKPAKVAANEAATKKFHKTGRIEDGIAVLLSR